jgi:hypothetical protein
VLKAWWAPCRFVWWMGKELFVRRSNCLSLILNSDGLQQGSTSVTWYIFNCMFFCLLLRNVLRYYTGYMRWVYHLPSKRDLRLCYLRNVVDSPGDKGDWDDFVL